MTELFNKLRVSRSDSYVITLILGALLFIFPGKISSILFLIVGLLMAIFGVVSVINGLTVKDRDGIGTATTGLVHVAVGLLLMFTRTWLLSTGIRLFGIFILVDGIIGIINQNNDTGEKALHIVLVGIGFILLVNPLSILFTTIRWAGIALMIDGIVGLVTGNNLIHR